MLPVEKEIDQAVSEFAGDDAGRSISVVCEEPIGFATSRSGSTVRPAASVMKIPLAMAVFRKAHRGELNLNAPIAVAALSKTRYVSVLAGFDETRTLSLREVVRLVLITSDNPLSIALQGFASFNDVNELMHDLGCGEGCRMEAGFTEAELGPLNRANILTTKACMTLLKAVSANDMYADVLRGLQNNMRNNRIPARLPESAVVAHKTGSLDQVANDVGIVVDKNVRFSIACLTDRQPDTERTTSDIAACSARIFELLRGYSRN